MCPEDEAGRVRTGRLTLRTGLPYAALGVTVRRLCAKTRVSIAMVEEVVAARDALVF